MASRMFPFITCPTWNPLGGECLHGCCYCWAKRMVSEFKMGKYQGAPRVSVSALEREFKVGEFVFACSMVDLFGSWVGKVEVLAVLDVIRNNPKTDFLLLTKNPARYVELAMENMEVFPENAVLGCTVESDIHYPGVSKAPSPQSRLDAMAMVADTVDNRLFFSVEPILKFSEAFFDLLTMRKAELWAVAVGYDNYGCRLPEPRLAEALGLVAKLEKEGITVYRKSLREAWNA